MTSLPKTTTKLTVSFNVMCNSSCFSSTATLINQLPAVISQYKLISAENSWHECKFKSPTGNMSSSCPNKVALSSLSLSLFHLAEVNKIIFHLLFMAIIGNIPTLIRDLNLYLLVGHVFSY